MPNLTPLPLSISGEGENNANRVQSIQKLKNSKSIDSKYIDSSSKNPEAVKFHKQVMVRDKTGMLFYHFAGSFNILVTIKKT
ncbi:hypothetical protein MTBBW1_1680054 [Desulfamplus magnetovallimortis]|uniref:Uncharacterized protein n=1 Tax=Desulfamplus magnetovallimortis TaxID=1246637 RepID=A0A1W1H9L0_9BACT|nr:hypothetical protein MTBBW1_1680054 [Desulfamplus magnetovallimortis]